VIDQPPPPIPVAEAFRLPSVNTCVTDRRLAFTLRDGDWRRVTVRINGKRVRERRTPGRVRLRNLPRTRFVLSVRAVRRDGRRATVQRRYQPCVDTRPEITPPTGNPPAALQTRDIVRGSGRRARSGSEVSAHYALLTWSDGVEKDSSWDGAGPIPFKIGSGQVIRGFERGITGMRIGGRREIIVPPALGYGDQGAPPIITPGETLMFVVDLVSVSG
jgi:peptidylprolyl isomerase